MKTISLKREWISRGRRKGFFRPVNAICGANDTGTDEDSTCRSEIREKELILAKGILKRNKISYRTMKCSTSNFLCMHYYLCVAPENRRKAGRLLKPLEAKTQLFYVL